MIDQTDLDKAKAETMEVCHKDDSALIDLQPLQSSASNRKELKETFDSEAAGGKDFKLVESELNDEVADEMDSAIQIS